MVLKLSTAVPDGSIPDSKRMCLNSMRLATIRFASTVVALLWLPGAIAGQVVPSPYSFLESTQELTFFIGTSNPSPGQLRIGMGSATVYGFRYGKDVGSALTLEVGSTVFAGDREVLDPRRAEGDRQIGVSDLTVASIEGRFRLNLTGQRTWHRLRPFILFGGGMAVATSEDQLVEDTAEVLVEDRFGFGKRFTAVAGAGIGFHVSSRLAIRLDASLNLWKITTPQGYRDTTRNFGPVPDSEWTGAPAFTLGTAFRF